MEGIKRIIENFYEANKHYKILLNKEQTILLMNSSFSFSQITSSSKKIKSLISLDEIIIAIKDYIIITDSSFLILQNGFGGVNKYPLSQFVNLGGSPTGFSTGNITMNNIEITKIVTGKSNMFELFDGLKKIIIDYNDELIRIQELKLIEIERENRIREEERIKIFKTNQNTILNELDKDGIMDLISNDFEKLLSKNQKKIIELDKTYIHQFIKVSNYIKAKKQNTQKIFESIRETVNQEELNERVNLLKNQIHSYELLVFHSINMIGSLVDENLITFYEIYESFDKLGIYNSNWENEVADKLTNIGSKLDELMYSIYQMEQNIVSELSHLSYVTQESFEELNQSVTSQLRGVESSINTNNLLTGIQAYQLYKINKNTKGLNQEKPCP